MSAKDKSASIEESLATLSSLADRISTADIGTDTKVIKRVRLKLEQISQKINDTATGLDPILRPLTIFDPTDPQTSGRVIALTLVAQARHSLAAIPEFYGAGVYALYYSGDFEAYRQLARTEHPIYVGKADPNHNAAKDAITQGAKLSIRLREHAKSISKANNLRLEDFECRFLIVQTGFQKSAEEYLIKFFQPIWNSETQICYGLGKHGDSSTTRVNKRSPWDTMHPGREWARATISDQKSVEKIVEEITAHCQRIKPYADRQAILDHFFADMRQLNAERFYSPIEGTVEIDELPQRTLPL